MLIVTINEVPGKKLEALGVVRGSTVQSRNLGHDLMAGFRTLVGGEVTDYADMLPGFLEKQPERPSVLMNLKEKCDAPECNPSGCKKERSDHEL